MTDLSSATSLPPPGADVGAALLARLDPDRQAFFLDVDGTLLDIAPRPELVQVPDGLVEMLGALHRRCAGALALVSGRSLATLDTLFAPLRLPAAGIHGAEIRLAARDELQHHAGPIDDAVRARLLELCAAFPHLHIEDKGAAIALHYRGTPAIGDALGAAVAEIVAPHAAHLAVLPGHFLLEVKASGHDKGTAVAAFLAHAPFRGRAPVFIGDDVTDEAAFPVVAAHGGLAVSVGRPAAGADAVLPDPTEVRELLGALVLGKA